LARKAWASIDRFMLLEHTTASFNIETLFPLLILTSTVHFFALLLAKWHTNKFIDFNFCDSYLLFPLGLFIHVTQVTGNL